MKLENKIVKKLIGSDGNAISQSEDIDEESIESNFRHKKFKQRHF